MWTCANKPVKSHVKTCTHCLLWWEVLITGVDVFASLAQLTDTLAYNTAIGACGAQGEWQRALRYLDVRVSCIDYHCVYLLLLNSGDRPVRLLTKFI
jgi:pentatricopeptide repeat protein